MSGWSSGENDETLQGYTEGVLVFDRFRLERMLGRGGMGVVWLGRDQKLEELVALKFMPETVRMDAPAIDDLKRETRKSRQLTHPSIVRIHDFVEDARHAAITMEYIQGTTLAQKRLQKPERALEPEELQEWVLKICDALEYAHQDARMVHRDLKPSNIMLTESGRIKITDFGISRSISDSVSQISALQARPGSGSPPYMSPQQVNGEPSTPADDIYSLGATIYDLLTGKPPFYSGDILHQIETKRAPRMSDRRREISPTLPALPAEWEDLVADCLAKEATERPACAAEVRDRVLTATKSTRSGTKSARATENVDKKSKRPMPMILGLSLALILGLIGLGAFAFQYLNPYSKNTDEPSGSSGTLSAEEATAIEDAETAAEELEDALEMQEIEASETLASDEAENQNATPPQAEPDLALMTQRVQAVIEQALYRNSQMVTLDAYIIVVPEQQLVLLSDRPYPLNTLTASYGGLPRDQRMLLLDKSGQILRVSGWIEPAHEASGQTSPNLRLQSVEVPGI